MRDICVSVSSRAAEFGIVALVLELISGDSASSWDATQIGLNALLSILLHAPELAQRASHPLSNDSVRQV